MKDRKKSLTDMMSADEKSGFYIDKFKKESKEIFDNEVKPQIERAMKMEKAAKNNIIEDWLEEHGDPEIDKKVEKQLELEEAARKWYSNTKLFDKGELNAFIAGAKWMQKQLEKLKDFDTWKEWKNQNN